MRPRPINRRVFLKQGAVGLVAIGLPPSFLTRTLLTETQAADRHKTVVFIFQRGAVDGLNMVVPFGEKAYYRVRRSIAVPQPSRGSTASAIDLDGFFGLHPSLRSLHDLFREGELAILHASGSPHPTRSHFDAQDFMESGTPGFKSTRDGWINRLLAENACACGGRTLADTAAHSLDHESNCPFYRIIIRDGQRYSLTTLADPDHHELTRFRGFC